MDAIAHAHQCIVLRDDRCASDIARRITGDEARWPELVAVNPQKRRSRVRGFDFLADGERLWLPLHWPKDPFSSLAVYPGSPMHNRRFETGALPSVVLPNGWVDDDLLAVKVMASDLGVSDPKSLMYVWASETGNSAQQQLNPRTSLNMTTSDPWAPFFAGGLNGSTAPVIRLMGFRSAAAWLGAPIRIQLQGIYRQYSNHVRAMGEGFDRRAAKLGTTTAALIYAFNFLPAYAVAMKSSTQILVQAGSPFYDTNTILDQWDPLAYASTRKKKGYICIKDFEVLTAPQRWPSGWPVYALVNRLDQLSADPALIASLGPTGSSIWEAVGPIWESLTGKPIKTQPPSVISESPPYHVPPETFPHVAQRWTPQQYWQATGAVLFAGFLIAYAQGWIRR